MSEESKQTLADIGYGYLSEYDTELFLLSVITSVGENPKYLHGKAVTSSWRLKASRSGENRRGENRNVFGKMKNSLFCLQKKI